ncbi:hypothetical protein JCM33374_g4508 [Metschnikowia sp. JCM 33374]|nr:hypothetical protein JCM33374_g4508 [Metschnikowia sp. JCM 33374]
MTYEEVAPEDRTQLYISPMLGKPDPTKQPVLDLLINEDYAATALLASGCDVNYIPEELVDSIGAKKKAMPFPWTVYLHNIPIRWTVELKFQSNGITFFRTCHVIPGLIIDVILGFEMFAEYGELIDLENKAFNGLPMYNT